EGFYWINKTGYAQSLAYAIEKRGKFKEAENLFKGSLKLAREHVGDESIEFLGWRLLHYGDFLVRARRYSEAEPMYNEGIEIIKKFAESQPMDYKRHLSDIFNNHAVLLRNRNRFNNAESFYLEALEIGRPQSEEFPESVFITYIVSTILNNMGVLFNQTNRISAGEESYLEALQIWRDVVEKSPVLFNNRLSVNLNNYGVMLSGIDRLSESERIFQESLEIKRQLAEQGEGLEIVGVASVLNNIGNLLKKLERFEEAQAAFKEACEIYEEVIKNVSERYIEDLKRTLGNLRLLLMQTESPATSIQTIESRLKELGVSDFIEQEEWFEEEIII
ncbi:MAG: tetratricopeptide repeat protein, partial [Promethearchaeota archaeon]